MKITLELPADAQILHELADFCKGRAQFWAGQEHRSQSEESRMLAWVRLMDDFRSHAHRNKRNR